MDAHQRRTFKRGVRFVLIGSMSGQHAVLACLPNGKQERVGPWSDTREGVEQDLTYYLGNFSDVLPFWLRGVTPTFS